jgi:tetratricopeptide (TPR) repeat protein/transcriptional regulator with XRE-family HTH domain
MVEMVERRVGEWVRSRRTELLLTQEELARRAGIGVRTIQNLESGAAGTPRSATLRRLVDVLGPMPATDLREAPDDAPDRQPAPVRPAQLPGDVVAFTGRRQELAALDTLLVDGDGGDSTAMAIAVVCGSGGAGKTALAVHWAHRVRDRFNDGQLYVNLRGYDQQQPVQAGEVLTRFLNALGVNGAEVPLDADERAARYRTMTAGRRLLIVLDNAGSAEQVRPLLPGAASCVVVVTSRDSLGGLVSLHGARRVELDRLPMADAVALLRRLLPAKVDAEPDAGRALAERCAQLPLALRVAAELATNRPDRTLTDLVAELADQRRRLDLLGSGGDTRAAVRAVFSWSHRQLSQDAARAFRLIGLHPGPDLDAYAAAALLDTDVDRARDLLRLLTRAYLAEPTAPGRFGMHDLLRAYAAELAASDDSQSQRQAALTRLFDYYLATAAAAMDVVFPEPYGRPRVPHPDTPVPQLADRRTALAWLDGERQVLAGVCVAAANRWPGHTVRLSRTLFRYHENGGYYTEMLAAHVQARAAARGLRDRTAEAHALCGLGTANYRLSGYHQAAELQANALAIFRDIGDRYGQARALMLLGNTYRRLGRYGSAVDHYQQAAVLSRELGDRVNEAYTLGHLGLVYSQQGHDDLAAERHQWALGLFRETGNPLGEAHALGSLGAAYARLGRYQLAADHQQRALVIFRQLGNRGGAAEALADLGYIDTRVGRHDAAANRYQQALALYREIGSRYGQAGALNGLGEAQYAAGRLRDAVTSHTTALNIAASSDDGDERARAQRGLASAHQALDSRPSHSATAGARRSP